MPRFRRGAAVVSLTFDDGTADHRAVGQLLADAGIAATFYVNSGNVGLEGFLTWHDVRELARLGHEIGGHTTTHPDLVTLDRDAAEQEIRGDKARLEEQELDVTSFAYPYGSMNADVRELVAAAGYASARRAWGLAADRAPSERVPPPDAFAIRTAPNFEHGADAALLQEAVTRPRGGWVPLVFHRISEQGTTWELSAAVFEPFVAWLVERRQDVRTIGAVISG